MVGQPKELQVKLLKRPLRESVFTLALLILPLQAASESYALNYDAIIQAENQLELAALDAPQRDRQDILQRDIHDIIFLLSQSWKAPKKSNDVAQKDYAQQALTLLQRSAAQGYFDLAKAKPRPHAAYPPPGAAGGEGMCLSNKLSTYKMGPSFGSFSANGSYSHLPAN
jgi:hypothetical protein